MPSVRLLQNLANPDISGTKGTIHNLENIKLFKSLLSAGAIEEIVEEKPKVEKEPEPEPTKADETNEAKGGNSPAKLDEKLNGKKVEKQ